MLRAGKEFQAEGANAKVLRWERFLLAVKHIMTPRWLLFRERSTALMVSRCGPPRHSGCGGLNFTPGAMGSHCRI